MVALMRAAQTHLRASALLVHGDPMVLDRWRWLRDRLPVERSRIVDAGCGNGWLTMNAARRGHDCVGLGFADEDLERAAARARAYGIPVTYQVQDLRQLDERDDLVDAFDVAVCTEVIEHVIDDQTLLNRVATMVRPGGMVLLTTPSIKFVPIDSHDSGPYQLVEDGGHVRKGYGASDLEKMFSIAGLDVVEISGCSGYLSQRLTRLVRWLTPLIGYPATWILTLPLRPIPPAAGRFVRKYWPPYSICVMARRPHAAPED